MGSLTPKASYVYERNGEEIYAREVGQSERKLIGYMYDKEKDPRTSDGKPLYEHIKDDQLWGNIRRAAKGNHTLQQALERVKILYYLTEDYEKRYGNRKT